MAGFLPIPLGIVNGAVTFVRREVTLADHAIDGLNPKAIPEPDGAILSPFHHDESLRAVTTYQLDCSPESGSSGTLNTINGSSPGDVIVIWTPSGNDITINHDVGNILLIGGVRFGSVRLDGPYDALYLFHRIDKLVEINRGIVSR